MGWGGRGQNVRTVPGQRQPCGLCSLATAGRYLHHGYLVYYKACLVHSYRVPE